MKENLKFQNTHEWMAIDGNIITLGITSYAAMHLGDINYLRLPKVGETFKKGDPFAEVESIKNVSSLYMPITGKIIAVNEAAVDNPLLVNDNPFATYLVKIEFDNPAELSDLLNVDQYEANL